MAAGVEEEFSAERLARAVKVVRQGGVVAFPTETYYGLAVDPFNRGAVERLFSLKQRPKAKPLLLLIDDQLQLGMLARSIPELYAPLMHFWPGPLTLVFPALSTVPESVTGGTGTVAARISSHSLACQFVHSVGHPLTGTSANLSGSPPCVSADEVRKVFASRIDYVLDGGQTPGGKGSTLVGIKRGQLVLLREGVIAFSRLCRACERHVGT